MRVLIQRRLCRKDNQLHKSNYINTTPLILLTAPHKHKHRKVKCLLPIAVISNQLRVCIAHLDNSRQAPTLPRRSHLFRKYFRNKWVMRETQKGFCCNIIKWCSDEHNPRATLFCALIKYDNKNSQMKKRQCPIGRH